MPNDTVSAAATGLPCEDRNPRDIFFEDIGLLARMASIAYTLTESGLRFDRAVKRDRGIYTFMFSEQSLDDINFAVAEVMDRAASLAARREAFEGEDE